MANTELLSIEAVTGEKLEYYFTPAAFISNFAPLIVILEESIQKDTLHFEYKMWNVLTPTSNSCKSLKCYIELLCQIIKELSEEYGCEEHIYIYADGAKVSSGMLLALHIKAHTLFLHKPELSPQDKKELNDLLPLNKNAFLTYISHGEDEYKLLKSLFQEYNKELSIELLDMEDPDKTVHLKSILDMLEKMTP